MATPGYFETMGIPIVQGRSFEAADEGSDGWVAVVNEALANKYWKGHNPIGQRLRPGGMRGDRWFTVIGVAKDVKQTSRALNLTWDEFLEAGLTGFNMQV